MNTTTKNAANSIVGKLTAGILAGATALLASSAAAQAQGDAVLVVGDSLEVGSAPHLRAALGGMAVDIDAENGRTSSEGARVLADRLGPEHAVVAFPLGTNDTSADQFAASLSAVQQLAGPRCVVVATVSRPPLRGAPAGELNRVVAQFAAQGTVQVADWRAAAATPGVLGRDRTHATGQGYALRANLLAEAIQACLVGGGAAGIPAPEDPNAKPPPREERQPPERRPRPRPGPPVRLPTVALFAAVGRAIERVASPVAAALRDVQTAATTAEPEPVLGAR